MPIKKVIQNYLTKLLSSSGYPKIEERGRSFSKKVTPLNLDSALIGFMNGDPTLMEPIFNRIEMDEHVEGCISARMSATTGLNLDFTAAEDSREIQRQRDFLKEVFDNLSVDSLIEDILEAKYRLFRVLEPRWKVTDYLRLQGWTKHDNDLFLFDRKDIYINSKGKKIPFGESNADWFKALKVRSKKSILLRVVRPFIIKTFGYDSWAHFIEVFSDPFRVGFYPDGANKEIREQVYQAVYTLGQDGAAALPMSARIEFVENSKTGDQTFKELVNKTEAGISKAILGHASAVDATPGKLGNEVSAMQAREDLVMADRRFAVRWLYRGFVKPMLVFNFSRPAPLLPVLTENEVITREEKRQALKLFWEMGGEVDPQQFEEMGVRVQEDAPLLQRTSDFVF